MAFNYSLAGVCEKIIRQTKDMVGQNYAFTLGRQVGALDFITSEQNAGGFHAEYTQSQDGKKVVRAKVLYKQRALPCEVQTGSDAMDSSVCDTAIEPVEKSADLTVADAIATYPQKFTNENLVQICQDSGTWIRDWLNSSLRAAREKLSEKIISKMAVGAGTLYRQDGTSVAAGTYQSVPILKTNSDGVKFPLTANYNDVLMDFQNMQFQGVPAIITQGNFQTALNLMGKACCNANTPYGDALASAGAAFFLDQAANQVLGAPGDSRYTRALMASFGASQLLWFNMNANIEIDMEHLKSMTIQDPVYPELKWDLDMKFDICTKTWAYQFSARFDVFNTFKSDAFKQNDPSPACDDELYGVTGIWKYQFGNV